MVSLLGGFVFKYQFATIYIVVMVHKCTISEAIGVLVQGRL